MSETFELLDVIHGDSYPTETVTLFMNVKPLKEMEKITEEILTLDPEKDQDRETELLKKQDELAEEARKASIDIELKGVPRAIWKAIAKNIEATTPGGKADQGEALNQEFVVRSTTQIRDSQGRVANFTDDQLISFYSNLREPDWKKILDKANELSFTTLAYEQKVTDPNFS